MSWLINRPSKIRLLFGFLILLAHLASAKEMAGWDTWYVVEHPSTVPGKEGILFAIYRERAFQSDSQWIYQNQQWKSNDQGVIEEHLGGTAKDGVDLTPVSFDYYIVQGGIKTEAVGSISNGVFSVELFPQELSRNVHPKTLPKNTILTGFFSLWVAKHLSEITQRKGGSLTFMALLEDGYQSQFPVSYGTVSLSSQPPTEPTCTQVDVKFNNEISRWCIEASGRSTWVDLLSQNLVIRPVSEATAKKRKKELEKHAH